MITICEPEIRAALRAHPELTDRQLARLLRINRWSTIRRVREAMDAAQAPPCVPWACATCGGTAPQAISDPSRCKACVRAATTPLPAPPPPPPVVTAPPAPPAPPPVVTAPPAPPHAHRTRIAQRHAPRPKRSAATQAALQLLAVAADDPASVAFLRRRYLVARAADYQILEVR